VYVTRTYVSIQSRPIDGFLHEEAQIDLPTLAELHPKLRASLRASYYICYCGSKKIPKVRGWNRATALGWLEHLIYDSTRRINELSYTSALKYLS
jgi:hypothetical protein